MCDQEDSLLLIFFSLVSPSETLTGFMYFPSPGLFWLSVFGQYMEAKILLNCVKVLAGVVTSFKLASGCFVSPR